MIFDGCFLHLTFICSRNPAQCYQKVPWKQFSMYAADVLSTFQVDTTLKILYEIESKLIIVLIGRVSNWTQQAGKALWWEIKRLNTILPSKFTCEIGISHKVILYFTYFTIARYLTNMNLLQLQLSDSNFRRSSMNSSYIFVT